MPRVDPLPESEWDDRLRPILDARTPGFDVRLGDNNIFPTLARHPDLFRAWLPFGGFLLGGGVLPARERELLILRTACNCRSSYEWGQHARIAQSLGMTRAEILRIPRGPEADGWTPAEAALVRAADELHSDSHISEGTWAALSEEHDQRGLIEIAMLVGHYHLVAYALNSLEVELDEGLESLPDPGAGVGEA